jgi:hypothetical protein
MIPTRSAELATLDALVASEGPKLFAFALVSGELVTEAPGPHRYALEVIGPVLSSGAVRVSASGVELLADAAAPDLARANAHLRFVDRLARSDLHEVEVSRTFSEVYAGQLLRVAETGAVWRYTPSGFWLEDRGALFITAAVVHFADDLGRIILPPKPKRGGHDSVASARVFFGSLVDRSARGRRGFAEAVLDRLQVSVRVFEEADRPDVILTPDGVLDLAALAAGQVPIVSGIPQLRASGPTDYFRACTRGRYRPGLRHAELDRIFDVIHAGDEGPDGWGSTRKDRETYLDATLGAAVRGLQASKHIGMWIGEPDSLKSTLAWLYHDALGGYSASLPSEAVLSKRDGGTEAHTSNRMDLVRAPRWVLVEELPWNRVLNSAFLKDLVGGGGGVWLAQKNQPGTNYQQRAVVCLVANQEVPLPGDDDGLNLRLRPFYFQNRISADEVDRNAIERLRADQDVLDALFTRAVDAAVELIRARGRAPEVPAPFRKELNETRSNHSPLATFIQSKIEPDSEGTFSFGDVWGALREFCRNERLNGRNASPGRHQDLTRALEREGYHRSVTSKRVWRGGKMRDHGGRDAP